MLYEKCVNISYDFRISCVKALAIMVYLSKQL